MKKPKPARTIKVTKPKAKPAPEKSSAPKLLLVFDESPEMLSFYLLDRKSEEAGWAREVADKYINGDDMTKREGRAFANLSNWMASKAGKDAKQPKGIIRARISEVVRIGFIL